MRTSLVTLFLASIVVFATCNNKTVVASFEDFVDGFAVGINYPPLDYNLEDCEVSVLEIKETAIAFAHALLTNSDELNATVTELARKISSVTQICSNVSSRLEELLYYVELELLNVDTTVMVRNFEANMGAVFSVGPALLSAVETQDFVQAGRLVAELFNIATKGTPTISVKSRRMLDSNPCLDAVNVLGKAIEDVFGAFTMSPKDFPKTIQAAEDAGKLAYAACKDIIGQDVEDATKQFIPQIENLTNNYQDTLKRAMKNAKPILEDLHVLESDIIAHRMLNVTAVQDIYNIILGVNTTNTTTNAVPRAVRRLEEVKAVDPLTIGLNVILGLQGFFEQGNTTVNATDYQNCANNVAVVALQIPTIQQAFASQNFSQIALALSGSLNQLSTVAQTCGVVKTQVVQWYDRDIVYLHNETLVVRALEDLFVKDLPDTLEDVADLIRDYRSGDFEKFGQAVGSFYNEFQASLTA